MANALLIEAISERRDASLLCFKSSPGLMITIITVARMANIAITTKSSMRVKPRVDDNVFDCRRDETMIGLLYIRN